MYKIKWDTEIYSHFINVPIHENIFFQAHTLTELNSNFKIVIKCFINYLKFQEWCLLLQNKAQKHFLSTPYKARSEVVFNTGFFYILCQV